MKVFKELLFGELPASDSPAQSTNLLDFKKTARHILVVAAGAVLTEVFSLLSSWLGGHDFGQFQMLVSFVISSGGLELLRRYFSDTLAKVDN